MTIAANPFRPDRLRLALPAALAVGLIGRLAYGYGAPLWFDETFSGVIATQPNVAALRDWCLNELTGPAYYMPLWAWVKVAGSSDMALRLPSVILSLAMPLLILWSGGREPELRRYWAILCLLWVPAFAAAWDARAYAQLFFLGAVQAIALLRLIERPSLGRAAAWVAVSSLLILTHYWSAVACVVQGCAFVLAHRRAGLACWPAALLLLPAAGWAYFHLPMVLGLTGGGVSGGGYALSVLATVPESLFGIPLLGVILAGAVAVSARHRERLRMTPETTLAACGVISVACVIALACVRPGFAPRYLTPAIPGFLFAIAVWLRWAARRDIRAAVVVLAVWFATALGVLATGIADPERDARHVFELERPSAWLAASKPRRLVLFWDGPVAARSSAAHLAEVGGFFFRRDGRPVAVDVARVGPGGDPNRAVLTLARPDAAIMWLANDRLPAIRSPRLQGHDPQLDCRDFGEGRVTLTACRRR